MLKKKHGSGFVERRLFACWWKPQAGGNPLQGLVGGRPISLVRIEYREVALAITPPPRQPRSLLSLQLWTLPVLLQKLKASPPQNPCQTKLSMADSKSEFLPYSQRL